MPASWQWIWLSPAKLVCDKCLPVCCGSLPHIERLIDNYTVELDQKVLLAACERGAPLHVLEYIIKRTTPKWRDVAEAATRGGHLHVFKWMMNRQDGRGPWGSDLSWCCEGAAIHGHLHLLKWLHSQGLSSSVALNRAASTVVHRVFGTADLCTHSEYAVHHCNGHLEVVQWLHEHTNACSSYAISDAAGNGHFEVVQWLFDNLDNTRLASAMERAARNGHLHIVRWLHQRVSCFKVCTPRVMDEAVDGGHVDVVRWLFDRCHEGCSGSAAWHAAINGDLEMLQWLDTHFNDQLTSMEIYPAASGGHLEVIKWLHEHQKDRNPGTALDPAAANGHLQALQWLHNHRREGCTPRAMNRAVKNGHLDVVKWLHENLSVTCSDSAMRKAAGNGHLEVVKWLNENGIGCCKGSLLAAAWAGHVDVVYYLAEHTSQRGSHWGLGAASRQGRLQVLLVLVQNYYRTGRRINLGARIAVCKCFQNTLRELSDQCASSPSLAWREVLKCLDQFHAGGFLTFVCIMLAQALEGGYAAMTRQFFSRRNEQEKREYLATAGHEPHIILLRWLVENGTPLDVPTAIKLGTKRGYQCYVEATWWLSETDRVTLVVNGLEQKKYFKLLLWVLENTDFKEDGSRVTIRNTIRNAPRVAAQLLFENLAKPDVRKWCF